MPQTKPPIFDLSKSSILYGLQCEKRLYWHVKERASEPAPDPATLALLEEGKAIEAQARRYFARGVAIHLPVFDAQEVLTLTQAALDRGDRTLFQPAFLYKGVFVRLDILDRLPNGKWRLIEIKAGTRVQRKHLVDVAIQQWVVQGAGVPVERCEVMHLNKECTHPNLEDLFLFQDVTPRLADFLKTFPDIVAKFRRVLEAPQVPERPIGMHCRHPSACVFEERCRKSVTIPPVSVFNIPKLENRVKWELYEKGHVHLNHVPPALLTSLQRRMVSSTLSGKRFVNAEGIKRAIVKWKEPFYYLDFETISPGVPRFSGMHPGNSFPFQFSVRTLVNGQITETTYLHEDQSDPRVPLAEHLLKAIGSSGSIVTYNKGTEKGALLALAACVPKPFADRLRQIATRLVDALPIIRAHVYDPAFGGSFSLKEVAPALFGKRLAYDRLSVGDGQAAQRAFTEFIDESTPLEKKALLRQSMLHYCGQDTEALVHLTEWLFQQSKS